MKRKGVPRNKRARQMLDISKDAVALHLSELAAWAVHELSQPLMVISANTQASIRLLDQADLANSVELQQSLQDVLAASQRAARTLKRMRALFVELGADRQAVNLNSLIQDVMTLLHSSSGLDGVDVQLSLAAELSPVSGNWGHLQQVFFNLALNGVAAMQDTPRAERRLCIQTAQDDPASVHAIIRDAGPYMPTTPLPGIFDALMTTQAGARGIGLRMAHSIVTAHGGEMRAELHAERGMIHHLTLPALHRPA